MSETITLNQLTEFYLNESMLLEELFGEKETKQAMGLSKETICNIKNYSRVLSVRPSNIIEQYEVVLN